MADLKDKTVIVTGAAGGIGRAIAKEAGRAGARLALVDADAARLDETATAIRADGAEVLPCVMDMTDRALWQKSIDDIAAHFCGIDVMVNNAMWVTYEPMAEVQEDDYRRQMAIGLDAVYWGIQAVTPHMIAQRAGSIINMTSSASVHGIPNGSVYAAVKGAISALTRQCAVELGQKGIRVNAVAPGPMPTRGTMRVVDEEGWKKRLAPVHWAACPRRRVWRGSLSSWHRMRRIASMAT
jgi:NAD(P)-dependent dehydrogenase (short-subunit alcohol dehydrogenase family)